MKKIFKRFITAIMSLAMVGSALTADIGSISLFDGISLTVNAEQEPVEYTEYSWDGSALQTTKKTATKYTVVTSNLFETNPDGLMGGTYVVNKDITINDYFYIRKNQTVNLIVQEGVTLTCKKGIGCGYDKHNECSTLNIYGEGKIVATGKKYYAGIGGRYNETSGNINIHGTTIEAKGGSYGAGIGAGEGGGNMRKAEDGGGEEGGTLNTINISGGIITATGGEDGPGIGSGFNEDMAKSTRINITGDDTKLTAVGKNTAAGIGTGGVAAVWNGDMYGVFTINCGKNSDIKVFGASIVNKYSGEYIDGGAGIGAAFGGNMYGKVYILGGNIEITGGGGAAGIGGGYERTDYGGEGNDVYIGGGNIKIRLSGDFSDNHAIGCGYRDGKDGSVYINKSNNTTGAYMRVAYSTDNGATFTTAKASDRSSKCHKNCELYISECDHNAYLGLSGITKIITPKHHVLKCKYCGWEESGVHDSGLSCHCGYRSGELDSYRNITLEMTSGDAQTGATQPMASTNIVEINTVFEIPECEYTPKGRRFTGWAVNNNTTDLKQPGETITISQDITLTAQYAELYTIGYNGATTPEGNWISISGGKADKDDDVTVTAHPSSGFRLKSVTVSAGDANGEKLIEQEIENGDSTFTFLMPGQDIYIDAEFEGITYSVSVCETEYGTVSADKDSFTYSELDSESQTVTVTVTPENSSHLDRLRCIKEDGTELELTKTDDTHYTFQMPKENVCISAEFDYYSDGVGSKLIGYTLSLDGDIGVNFYMELDPTVAASSDAYMYFTLPGKSFTYQTVYVKEQSDAFLPHAEEKTVGIKTYYVFKCNVAAKEMTSEIKAQLFDGTKQGTEYTYSVKEYADYLLKYANAEGTDEQKAYAKAAPLVRAMLNYSAYSQTYFGTNTQSLANEGLTNEEKSLDDVTTIEHTAIEANLPTGVTFEGATLSLKSETTLSLFFKNKSAGDVTFKLGTEKIEAVKNNGYLQVRITGIKARQLSTDFTVTVNDSGSVTYSPINYCQLILNGNYPDVLKDVVKALYKYSKAADIYFNP